MSKAIPQDPAFRLTEFLAAARQGAHTGCRAAGDGTSATQIELHYHERGGGPKRVLGLRAEVRDGQAVIVLDAETRLHRQPAPLAP